MRLTCFASLLAFVCLPGVVQADTDLTLDLPSSRAKPKVTPAPKPPQRASRQPSRLASRHGGWRRPPVERVVGRLGVLSRSAAIRAGRRSDQRVLAQVNSGTYIAITQDYGEWYGVLMADKSTGWIPKQNVNVLDYEVVSQEREAARQAVSSAPDLNSMALRFDQRAVLQQAYSYLGVPYRWGGTSPNGLDCSGFVQRCFAAVGVRLPRTAREQIHVGMPVSGEDLQAGDRLYFSSSGYISHTGIYIGNGYFIHSSSSRKGVAVSQLSEAMYQRMYAGARR